MTKTAFAIAAHPDDIEFMMAGTLLLLRDAGYEIHYLSIANGSCGTMTDDAETIARIRLREAMEAAKLVGAIFHEPMVEDLEIFYEKRLLARVASVIREVAPEILLVPSPEDYMEDHMNACRLSVTGAFCRSMRNFPVDPPRAVVTQEVTLYHAQPYGLCDYLGKGVRPDFFVDISSVMDEKTAMLSRHASQQSWLDESQSGNAYLMALSDMAREMGRQSRRFELAEGWRRHNHLGLCAADADPLAVALAGKVAPAVA